MNGYDSLVPDWQSFQHPRKSRSTHWLADTEVFGTDIKEVMPRIETLTRDIPTQTNVYIYSGVHGSSFGDNWIGGVRRGGAAKFHVQDVRNAFGHGLLSDNVIITENISAISKHQMKRKMKRSGHHVHAYCFSLADSLVMKELRIDAAKVYDL